MATLQAEILADLSAIFDTGGLAVSVSHIISTTTENLTVLFDNPVYRSMPDTGDLISEWPQILAVSSDLDNVTPASRFVIDSTNYYVVEIEPDQNGITRIILSKDQVK